jgi:glycosyltransferase involved in cell wall biosynthesis
MPPEKVVGQSASEMFISVVMPVFNERNWIEEILRRVQAVEIRKKLILGDDSFTDGTREWLQEAIASVPPANAN